MFDLQGRWLSSIREIRQHADRVALGLMDGVGCEDCPVVGAIRMVHTPNTVRSARRSSSVSGAWRRQKLSIATPQSA